VTDERGSWKWSVSLYGSCAGGTWSKGLFTEDPEGFIKEDSGDGHFSTLQCGPSIRASERQMKEGSRNGASLCMAAVPVDPGGRAPFLGTLKDK